MSSLKFACKIKNGIIFCKKQFYFHNVLNAFLNNNCACLYGVERADSVGMKEHTFHSSLLLLFILAGIVYIYIIDRFKLSLLGLLAKIKV